MKKMKILYMYHSILIEILHMYACKDVPHTSMYTVFQKKTPTHIVGYKLRNSCLILIIFDIKIADII